MAPSFVVRKAAGSVGGDINQLPPLRKLRLGGSGDNSGLESEKGAYPAIAAFSLWPTSAIENRSALDASRRADRLIARELLAMAINDLN
jgi:hypothetical protein